jgi:hypothetical protein
VWRGAAAGAAGTTALNAVTYLDMVLRGRPASTTPERGVEQLAREVRVEIPGDEHTRPNRVSGLGALTGIGTGVGVGALYGMVRGLGVRLPVWAGALLASGGAMAAANVPMTAQRIVDPTTWSPADWLADAIPHAAYGIVTAATYATSEKRRPRRNRRS